MQQPLLYKDPALSLVSRFLNIRELLGLMTLSRKGRQLAGFALADILAANGIPLGKLAHKANLVIKEYMNCSLRWYSFENLAKPIASIFVGGCFLKGAQTGLVLSAVLTTAGQLRIYQNKSEKIVRTIGQVRAFTAKGKGVVFLTESGKVIQLSEDGEPKQLLQQYGGQVHYFYGCSSYLVLQITDQESFNKERKVIIYHRQSESVSLLHFDAPIHQVQVAFSTKTIYLLSQGVLYKANFIKYNQTAASIVRPVPDPDHKQRNVGLVKLQERNGFVIERRLRVPLQNWTVGQVAEWAEATGLEDYVRILKVQKVDGARLKSMAKSQMVDLLGLENWALQNKIETLVNDEKGDAFEKDLLFVTGRNEFGELGLPASKQVNQVAPLPNLKRGERIAQIESQQGRTALVTNYGRVFLSVYLQKQKRPEEEQQLSEQQQSKEKGKKEKKKAAKGKEQKRKQEKEPKRKEQKARNPWVELACGRALGVTVAKSEVSVLQCWQGASSRKYSMARQAINKILWDDNLRNHVHQFRVGYQDKYMGLLEMPIEEYAKSEVKEHRVVFIKREGRVVWDREEKVDLL